MKYFFQQETNGMKIFMYYHQKVQNDEKVQVIQVANMRETIKGKKNFDKCMLFYLDPLDLCLL